MIADMMDLTLRKLSPENINDFWSIHDGSACNGCYCVAWHVPTWDGWGERSAEQNRQLRHDLFAQGIFDGFLLYKDGGPIGWCQLLNWKTVLAIHNIVQSFLAY